MWLYWYQSLSEWYQDLAPALYWPGVYWKAHLISLAITKFGLDTYLNYRQYHVLRRPFRPQGLCNVITQQEYSSEQGQERKRILHDFWTSLYNLCTEILLISWNVFPRIWIGAHLTRSEQLSQWTSVNHDRISCILFWLFSCLVWKAVQLPMVYYNQHAPETQHSKEWKESRPELKTSSKKKPWTPQIILIGCWCWTIWSIAPLIEEGISPDFLLEIFFIGFGFILPVTTISLIIFLRPITPAKVLGASALKDGRTKMAIEEVAKQLDFPLKGIYAQDDWDINSDVKSDLLIWGFPWQKKIGITQLLLEKCNAEEISAVVAQEIGSWKHNHVRQALALIFTDMGAKIPILILFTNWIEVCRSFNFNSTRIWPSQHPIIVILLLYGGALSPITALFEICINFLNRAMETHSDSFATKHGYNTQLCRALIKMYKAKEMDILESDWLYSLFYGRNVPLPNRLEALGWMGDEAVDDGEGKLFDHWG